MRILLVSPNTLTVPYPVYPLGLDYVAGAIGLKHEVRIADMNVTGQVELAELLRVYAPEIIGISCRNIDNTEAGDPLAFVGGYRQFVQWLRQYSDAVLVCGGSGFTIMPAQVFAALDVDYGIVGEGERFALLADALASGANPGDIPGVMTSADRGEAPLPWQGEPARLFRQDAGHIRFYLEQGGMLNLQSKRGCSFSCIYCPYPHIEGSTQRLVPPPEVARTALALQEAGARFLFITDSAFNSDIRHSLEVAGAFREAELKIPWGAFIAPVRLPPEYFRVMAGAGCSHVEFGTESLSGAMLRRYRKPFRETDVLAAHHQAREAGIHVAHYFLLGGPGESAATISETLDRIEQLDRAVLFFFIGIRIYPNTALYDIALGEGKIVQEQNLLQPVYYKPDDIALDAIESMVRQRAGGRINWIIGSGGSGSAAVVKRMHGRGYAGPLWEYLAR